MPDALPLTTAQAALRLGVTPSQVRRLILAGRLPATKFGRDLQIRPEDVEALLPRPKPGRPRAKENER
jgi:excisionase family DNA binding protein